MMKFIAQILTPLLALFFAVSPANAYWEYGHETVARIAEANLSSAARSRMHRFFRAAPLIGTDKCPLSTIRKASVWADCIKQDRLRWGHTFSWHYQNVDICKPFDMESACRGGNCVSAQVDRNFALLKDKTLPDNIRLEALAFLVHFVGDLHMPLHSGDRSDRGGNDVSAAYGIIAGRTNLHSLWDGPLAERAISDGPDMVRRYLAAEQQQFASGTTADWARQAWEASRDFAYPTVEDKPACEASIETRGRVDDNEIAALVPVQRRQIRDAGLRLAKLLNEALS